MAAESLGGATGSQAEEIDLDSKIHFALHLLNVVAHSHVSRITARTKVAPHTTSAYTHVLLQNMLALSGRPEK